MAGLQIADMATAVELYYKSPELGNNEIMELFNCKRSAALRQKRKVQAEQDKQGKKTFSKSTVNTRLAYRVWGIDIKDLDQRLSRYHTLKKKGVFSREDF